MNAALEAVRADVKDLTDKVASVQIDHTELAGKFNHIAIDVRRLVWMLGVVLTSAVATAARVWIP